MNIAGLDIASTTGLACMIDAPKGKIITTSFRPKKRFFDGDKSFDAARESRIGGAFAEFLRAWFIEHAIGYVAIEQPLMSNTTRREKVVDTQASWAGKAVTYHEVPGTSMSTIYRLYGLSFLACSICNSLNIPVVMVAQQTWRKAFLGTGAPGKRAAAKEAAEKECRRLGIEISGNDAAEAAGIVFWLNTQLFPYGRANELFAGASA